MSRQRSSHLRAEKAFGEIRFLKRPRREPLPIRVIKGAATVGAGALIAVGFGVMLLATPKHQPERFSR